MDFCTKCLAILLAAYLPIFFHANFFALCKTEEMTSRFSTSQIDQNLRNSLDTTIILYPKNGNIYYSNGNEIAIRRKREGNDDDEEGESAQEENEDGNEENEENEEGNEDNEEEEGEDDNRSGATEDPEDENDREEEDDEGREEREDNEEEDERRGSRRGSRRRHGSRDRRRHGRGRRHHRRHRRHRRRDRHRLSDMGYERPTGHAHMREPGDSALNCLEFIHECTNPTYKGAMDAYCLGSCGALGSDGLDVAENCRNYEDLCETNNFLENMKMYCRGTCHQMFERR